MNSINFTGVKNIGALTAIGADPNQQRLSTNNFLLVNLTDDYNGKDLTNFKDAVRKCNAKVGSFINDKNSNFVHITYTTVSNPENETEQCVSSLRVNGKKVILKDENLPLFSFIAKLTDRISDINDEDFVLNRDFVTGPEARELIIPGADVAEIANQQGFDLEEFLDHIYSPAVTRLNAQAINQGVQKMMMDYFA